MKKSEGFCAPGKAGNFTYYRLYTRAHMYTGDKGQLCPLCPPLPFSAIGCPEIRVGLARSS